MPSIGQGFREIRLWDEAGTFRVAYVARFTEAIFVLHCFQKKTDKTARTDLALATKCYRELLKDMGK